MRVDQVLPTLASRDAIGVHTLTLTNALRAAGIDSDIYYAEASDDMAHRGRSIHELGRYQRDRWILYQASIGHPVFDLVAERDEPKLVNYHNITPSSLLEPWEPGIGYQLDLGREQLERMSHLASLAFTVSRFNEAELSALGYRHTEVVPLLIDMTGSGADADLATADRLARLKSSGSSDGSTGRSPGGADLLFVGKVSPHKAPHDLVAMLKVYRRLYDPLARLHLVGGSLSGRYETALLTYADRLGLARAVNLAGSVTPAQLEAYYRGADAFVCASEHEGFCVPLVEAMHHGLPVIAYASSAVPETVGDAGIVVAGRSPSVMAAAVARVLTDEKLRQHMTTTGRRRAVANFAVDRSIRRMVQLISDVAQEARHGIDQDRGRPGGTQLMANPP